MLIRTIIENSDLVQVLLTAFLGMLIGFVFGVISAYEYLKPKKY